MADHKIEFEVDAVGHGKVLLDGRPINARRIEVIAEVGEATIVKFSLVNVDVTGIASTAREYSVG